MADEHTEMEKPDSPLLPFQRTPSHKSIRNQKLRSRKAFHSDSGKIAEEESSFCATNKAFSLDEDPICISKDSGKSDPGTASEQFYENDEVKLLNDKVKKDISQMGGCIECVKAIPVRQAEEIEVGDHIIFAGVLYDHHGIVVKKSEENERKLGIVEATNTISGAIAGMIFGGKAKIQYSEKPFDLKTDNIRIMVYRKSHSSTQKIIDRALEMANNQNEFKYHLFSNNCEHFATYCITGERFSVQVLKFRMIARMFFSGGFRAISDEKLRNEKEHENRIICSDCFKINQKLFNAKVTLITCKDDVNIGDIVRYRYYRLWHDAVVLCVRKRKKKYVKCEIAHYCFRGFFSHREIIREKVKFNLHEFSVVGYHPPEYDVYEPDIVVERAQSRIGEKVFSHLSNDSSHFARWCKMKLIRSKNTNPEFENN